MIGISGPNSIFGLVSLMQQIGARGDKTLDNFAITLEVLCLVCLFFINDREITNVSPMLRL